jgi:AraC-like DNA-binding protein
VATRPGAEQTATASAESGYRQWRAGVPGVTLWTRRVGPAGSTGRILPDGCLDLIAVDGELLVAGPDTRAWLSTSPPGTGFAAVRFDPGVGPAVLGVPGYELRNARVPLAALWPARRVRALTDRLAAAADSAAKRAHRPGATDSAGMRADRLGATGAAGTRVDRLGAAAAAGTRVDPSDVPLVRPGGLLDPGGAALGPSGGAANSVSAWRDPAAAGAVALATALAEPLAAADDPALRSLVAALRRGMTVGAIAAGSYLSERQLHRRCRDAFGYGPKTLARILRMNRALDAARAGRSLVEVAAAVGYADQAHLSRDVRALTGVPPSTLLAT